MPKKSKLATSYWEKRRQLEDAARLKMENETIKELTSIFPDALKQIQEALLSQADLHDISLQDLLALPTKRTQEEYRKYIDARYQELMDSDDAYQEFIDEFFPAYDYAKVNRLTQIRADIFSIMTAEMMKKDVNQKFNDRLEDILQRSYSSNANALTYLLGGDFHQLPKRELEEMLNYPWTGKTFSQRLWGNVSKLEERLSNAIVNSVGAGKGMRDILATMKNDPQVSALFRREEDKFDNAIENLVRTEYAHFAVEGIKKSFADTGVKKAVSWSAEDERVCSICGGMHGKEVKENESGPPYHGRCRCTLMPKMPELDTAAIDAEYEALFGDLLDEFAKDNFGVKLSHPKKVFDPAKRMDFLKKEMDKLEDEDWDDLTEEEAEELFEQYESEYAKLKEKYGSVAYNKGEFKAVSDEEISKFFDQQDNYKKWFDSLSEKDQELIWDYTANTYDTFNGILREGADSYFSQPMYRNMPDTRKKKLIEDAKRMGSLLKNYEVGADFVTYRRINGTYDLSKFEIGGIDDFDDGYMSTSLSLKQTEEFGGGSNEVLFTIHVKKGQKVGAYIANISNYEQEKEFLIAPKTKFKILKISKETTANGERQLIELEAVE